MEFGKTAFLPYYTVDVFQVDIVIIENFMNIIKLGRKHLFRYILETCSINCSIKYRI